MLEAEGISEFDFLCLRKLVTQARAPTVQGEAGRLAKRALNELRVLSLRESGAFEEVRLVEYCSGEISPENHLILARKNLKG